MNKWNLEINNLYLWCDEHVKLMRFVNQQVILERENGQVITMKTSEFVSKYPIPVNADPSLIIQPTPSIFDNISKSALKQVDVLQAHLEIAIHGIEPMNESETCYDAELTTLTCRMKKKAEELKMDLSSFWRKKKKYERFGRYGLIDRRSLPLARSKRNDSDPVVLTIEKVLKQTIGASDVTNIILYRKIKKLLIQDYGDTVSLPSVATLNRLLAEIRHRLGIYGNANQRQKSALTPKKLFGSFRSTHPGQLVMFDSTKLDMFALDPMNNDWIQVALTIAFDFYSRSIIGWRFTPVDTKGVDAALVLFDVLHPKIAMPDWADIAHWNYFGVPSDIRIIEYTNDDSSIQIAAVPFVQPDTVLIDHGKVFISHTFQDVCTRLGIHIQRARIRRPTDKSPVENVFKHISQDFCQRLPGYKGRSIATRGIDIEKKAFYYIEEIDTLFAEWVATKWQNHIPRSLHYPASGAVEADVTPNDAYTLGLTQTGFIPIPNLVYFDCLETEYRIVSESGITIQYLEYDSIELEPFRNYPSEIRSGIHKGDYRIKADPRDRSQIFFFDEIRKTWITIPWRGKQHFSHPFSDLTLAFAKATAIEHLHGKKPTNDEIRFALEEMYSRWEAKEFRTRRERRVAARDKILTQQAQKDRLQKSKSTALNTIPAAELNQSNQPMIPEDINGIFKRFDQIKSLYQEDDDEF